MQMLMQSFEEAVTGNKDFPFTAANKPLTSTRLAVLADTPDHPQNSDPSENPLCNWHSLPSQDDFEAATDLPGAHAKPISLLLRTWHLCQDLEQAGDFQPIEPLQLHGKQGI